MGIAWQRKPAPADHHRIQAAIKLRIGSDQSLFQDPTGSYNLKSRTGFDKVGDRDVPLESQVRFKVAIGIKTGVIGQAQDKSRRRIAHDDRRAYGFKLRHDPLEFGLHDVLDNDIEGKDRTQSIDRLDIARPETGEFIATSIPFRFIPPVLSFKVEIQ